MDGTARRRTDESKLDIDAGGVSEQAFCVGDSLLLEGASLYSMFKDFDPRDYHWVLPVYRYKEPEQLLAALADVIAPAEGKADALEKRRREAEFNSANARNYVSGGRSTAGLSATEQESKAPRQGRQDGRIPMDECPGCRGEKIVPCVTCEGTGKRFQGFFTKECKKCAGTGRCPCAVCGGTGIIQTPPQLNGL
jgi:hypothetical protein